jgi:hypothetical protein
MCGCADEGIRRFENVVEQIINRKTKRLSAGRRRRFRGGECEDVRIGEFDLISY